MSRDKNKNVVVYFTFGKLKNIFLVMPVSCCPIRSSDVRMEATTPPTAEPRSELLEKLGGTIQVKPLFM